jgi:hypothetical protein
MTDVNDALDALNLRGLLMVQLPGVKLGDPAACLSRQWVLHTLVCDAVATRWDMVSATLHSAEGCFGCLVLATLHSAEGLRIMGAAAHRY